MQNEQLKLYESIDIPKEEQIIREQLKIFFNYIIDHITIKETIRANNEVILTISMYLKLNGYAPKHTLSLLKDLPTGELKEKASHLKNDLLNGGGEGGI